MGNRAARLAAFAVAAIAVPRPAAAARRSPPTPTDAGGEPTGAPSVSDAAREPLDACVETPTDAPPTPTTTSHERRQRHGRRTARGRARGPAEYRRRTRRPRERRRTRRGRGPRRRSRERRRAVRPHARRPLRRPPRGPAVRRAGFQLRAVRVRRRAWRVQVDLRDERRLRYGPALQRRPVRLQGARDLQLRATNVSSGFLRARRLLRDRLCRSLPVVRPAGRLRNLYDRAARRPDPFDTCGAGATCNGRGGCVPSTCVADSDCGDLYSCRPGTASRAAPPASRRPSAPPALSASCATSARTAAFLTAARACNGAGNPPRFPWSFTGSHARPFAPPADNPGALPRRLAVDGADRRRQPRAALPPLRQAGLRQPAP